MKRNFCKRFAAAMVSTAVLMCGISASAAENTQKKTLQFTKEGKFVVMQFADVQEYGKTNRDSLRVMEAALARVKPDLVVFTGDQVEGYATYFKYGNREERVRQTIDNLLAPVDAAGVPFAVVFGNHDQQSGVSKEEQLKMYQAHPGCVAVDEAPEVFGCGTYHLPILSSGGERTAFNLYMVDSNSDDPAGGYDNVHQDQIALCKQISEELTAANNGKPVPSLLFQHIPVEELYYVLKEVPEGTKGAHKWYRNLKPGYFAIDEDNMVGKKTDNFFFRESIASPNVNSGQFDAWLEQGDIIGAYFGHDHINNFVGNYKGIDLGYGLGTSYNAYGAGKDGGVRVYVLDENTPLSYETYGLQYSELCGDKMLDPVAGFFSSKLSFPATEAAVYGGVALAGIAVLAVASVIIVMQVKKKKKLRSAQAEKEAVTK